jgi:ArsR family transcriptional regulator, arsenate/arsenite/antimonite-responsive transcriptional repressor
MTQILAGLAEPSVCCAPVTGGVLDDVTAARLAQMFKALGDPTRVKLVSLIAAADDAEACVCDLLAHVPLAQPTVSHHLKLLVEAGLITREQRGKWAYYRIASQTLAGMAQALTPA